MSFKQWRRSLAPVKSAPFVIKRLPPPIKQKLTTHVQGTTRWSKKSRKTLNFISSSEIMAASVKPRTQVNYRGAGTRFYKYLDQIYKNDPTFPRFDKILNEFNLQQLDVIMREYLTVKFNATQNTGGTLRSEACGILYCLAVDYGIAISSTLLPSVTRICKGVENLLEQMYGKRVKGKYPILNPILEAMLKHATPDEQWDILLAQRYALRSQHYCNNHRKPRPSDASDDDGSPVPVDYLRTRDIRFIPNIKNPRALTIISQTDKNHQDLTHMERTVYCSCHTPWTCIVHMAQRRFINNKYPLDAALAQCRTGDMHYSAMRSIVRSLIEKIGLDKSKYGTHSLRSGGTSELYIEGRSGIFIKSFGWWKNLGSIFVYIKPNNPDLLKFVPTYTQYRESRVKESGLTDKIDQHWHDIWTEIDKQQKKVRSARRVNTRLAQSARIHGPVRGPLNRTTFQNRLPISTQHQRTGPSAQWAAQGQSLHRSNKGKYSYTNYQARGIRMRPPSRPAPRPVASNVNQRIFPPVARPRVGNDNNNNFVLTSVGFRQNPYKR